MDKKLIFVCSPLRGDMDKNIQRAYRYCRFVFIQGGVPLAPHTIFTTFIDDNIPDEREAGIMLGIELLKRCSEMWLFGNKLTEGMRAEFKIAKRLGIKVRYFTEQCVEVNVHGKA